MMQYTFMNRETFNKDYPMMGTSFAAPKSKFPEESWSKEGDFAIVGTLFLTFQGS